MKHQPREHETAASLVKDFEKFDICQISEYNSSLENAFTGIAHTCKVKWPHAAHGVSLAAEHVIVAGSV